MGFTVEDMLLLAADRYHMKLEAGARGWSNSISWLMMVEDLTIIEHFDGKELAVTTGLGFPSEEKLMALLQTLLSHHACGLIINTGRHILTIPDRVKEFCDVNDLPLLSVPWEVHIADMIKDLTMRIFLQGMADEQTSSAFIRVIEEPRSWQACAQELLPYFDVDGSFQVILISNGSLDQMDTVERKRLGYRIEIFLENITHNSDFFYYDSSFVLIGNNITRQQMDAILDNFINRFRRWLSGEKLYVGIGSVLPGLQNLLTCYQRARAAMNACLRLDLPLVRFDEMGLYRLLTSSSDLLLLQEMGPDLLRPLLDHDRQHGSSYVKTLEEYLACGGSYQKMARKMFIHRNTLLYRMNKIEKLLGTSLESPRERIKYQLACLILHLKEIQP